MILISGATGTLGVKLIQKLIHKGLHVRALVMPNDPFQDRLATIHCEKVFGDITHLPSLKNAFHGIDTVYHMAAVILAPDNQLFDKINVLGTQNMLKQATLHKSRHFIYISSASVTYPLSTPYSRSKKTCEALVRKQKHMPYTIVRPTLVYEEKGGQEFMIFRN